MAKNIKQVLKMTTAKIIADSISESGIRITTMELEYPRYIHSQFMTHRQFSRNAQSSRAVPTQKLIGVLNNNESPQFRHAQKGMQAGEIIDPLSYAGCEAKKLWIEAKNHAVFYAKDLAMVGVAKEITNRLLEPFNTIKVVVTATEWDNFFNLRLHHDAQPEIQELAQSMKKAMDESTPILLRNGDWHLPYITDDDRHEHGTDGGLFEEWQKELPKISAARCARVSYLNHDNSNPDIEKDLQLARHLLESGHLSPFEHQARPMDEIVTVGIDNEIRFIETKGVTHQAADGYFWSNNFRGWIQHRALL